MRPFLSRKVGAVSDGERSSWGILGPRLDPLSVVLRAQSEHVQLLGEASNSIIFSTRGRVRGQSSHIGQGIWSAELRSTTSCLLGLDTLPGVVVTLRVSVHRSRNVLKGDLF